MHSIDQADADVAFQQLAAVQLALGASATFGTARRADVHQSTSGEAKRGRYQPSGRASAQVALVQDGQGVLRWDYRGAGSYGRSTADSGGRLSSIPGASRYRAPTISGRVIASAEVAEVGLNEVTSALQQLDARLTPHQGLRIWTGVGFAEPRGPNRSLKDCKRLLILVHGTFSSGEMFAEQLNGSFFEDARQRYSHIVAFDHPTLSVSPMLNALDLEQTLCDLELPDETAEVDVICHSRGGLVISWWLRSTRFKVRNLVAVAAPLKGTSLASPYRIRYLLDYLANLSRFLGTGLQGAAAFPSFASGFLAGAGGLMSIFGGLAKGLSSVPIADVSVALVPGLLSQSYVENNAELSRLWKIRYRPLFNFYVVSSDYEAPRKAPLWNVVAQLKQLPWVAADGLADRLFPGQNDLVVDTHLMAGDFPVKNALTFSKKDAVHHCAYFRRQETVEKLRLWLEL